MSEAGPVSEADTVGDPDATAERVTADQILAADDRWRRLDPRMLLVHPVNEVMRFLPALIGFFLIGTWGSDAGWDTWWHLVAVGVPIVLGVLRYATTTFRIADGALQLRRGLINRAQLTARLDRIRAIELRASPIHRLLRLATVEIGTAGAGQGGDGRLRLDALPLPQARALRVALLHRISPSDASAAGTMLPETAVTGTRGDAVPEQDPRAGTGPHGARVAARIRSAVTVPLADEDEVLLRLDPRWVRFAPLTTAGLVVAAAVAGATSRFTGPLIGRLIDDGGLHAGSVPVWLVVVAAALAFLVLITVLSLIGYVLSYWGFVLSRDQAGHSLHVTRGLATSRETSVEIARIRGVERHEPLGLRLAGAARLSAIVTGMSRREAGVVPLVPPAPRGIADGVAAAVVGASDAAAAPRHPSSPSPDPLRGPLVRHGERATRRRYQRALTVAAVIDAAWLAVVLAQGWGVWLLLLLAGPPIAATALARDRARRLGHALTPRYLISRAHSLRGRRVVLLREGIIGWTIRQTPFQRRAGLVTLTATTAAGRQGYRIHDLPEPVAVALADEAVPGMLTPFVAPAGAGR